MATARGRSPAKTLAWERTFSKADVKRFGEAGPPEADRRRAVGGLHEKEAVLAAGHRGFFTIPHFDGYAAVLIQLKAVAKRPLRDVLVDGWLAARQTIRRALPRGQARQEVARQEAARPITRRTGYGSVRRTRSRCRPRRPRRR